MEAYQKIDAFDASRLSDNDLQQKFANFGIKKLPYHFIGSIAKSEGQNLTQQTKRQFPLDKIIEKCYNNSTALIKKRISIQRRSF